MLQWSKLVALKFKVFEAWRYGGGANVVWYSHANLGLTVFEDYIEINKQCLCDLNKSFHGTDTSGKGHKHFWPVWFVFMGTFLTTKTVTVWQIRVSDVAQWENTLVKLTWQKRDIYWIAGVLGSLVPSCVTRFCVYILGFVSGVVTLPA